MNASDSEPRRGAPKNGEANGTASEPEPKVSPGPFRRSAGVFLLFVVVYLITWGGHYTSGDGAQKRDWAKAMLSGPAEVPPPPGGVYSKYGIGHSLIAMPALACASFLQKHTGIRCEAALYTLIFVVNGALFLALVAYYLFHFYKPDAVWGTAALIGLATSWWPYTKVDFSEALVATILFAGFILMRFGHPAAGMLLAAFTLTIRADSILPVALLALWWVVDHPTLGSAIKLGLAGLPSLLVVAASNYARYRSVFDLGYPGEWFSTPFLVGMDGILLSPGKSVFLFSPPLILGFLGWKCFRDRTGRDALLFLGIFAAQLLLYSKWWDWSSDDAWGVRFMLPGVVFMCVPAVAALNRRWMVATIGAAGIFVQLLAVLAGNLDYLVLMRAHQSQRQALFTPDWNRVDFEDIRFNPSYSQIAGTWILLRHLLHVPPHTRPHESVNRNGTPLYDTLPPTVWSQAAHWDFIWLGRSMESPSTAR